MRLPAAREINAVPTDLDGKRAEKHFVGKTMEEAEALFREASLMMIILFGILLVPPLAMLFRVWKTP